ncbi:hypothetical protein DAMA08_029310 [Martiniozyma asiatica (nom. inval.)]|nr:hypothetical protein DAMA08_029310 [Martiniozyma asiatica]
MVPPAVTPTPTELQLLTKRLDFPITVAPLLNGTHNFVSTIDHLPCDIVRSLWIIQSLELRNIRLQRRHIKSLNSADELDIKNFNKLDDLIKRNAKEAQCESKHLEDIINYHRQLLNDENDMNQTLLKLMLGWSSDAVEQRWREWCQFKIDFLKNNNIVDFKTPKIKIKINLGNLTQNDKGIKSKFKISKAKSMAINKNLGDTAIRRSKQKQNEHERQSRTQNKNKSHSKIGVNKKEKDTYCFCHGPSLGKMVACDNETCPNEWYHYKCVGLKSDPKNDWFCSDQCRNAHMGRNRGKGY